MFAYIVVKGKVLIVSGCYQALITENAYIRYANEMDLKNYIKRKDILTYIEELEREKRGLEIKLTNGVTYVGYLTKSRKIDLINCQIGVLNALLSDSRFKR